MFDESRILVVVPARGGSKGVKHKNIHPLNGRPLIAYTADLVKELPFVDRAVVSTDDEAIARVATEAGLAVPFYRPETIAGDRIGDVDVLRHALLEMEQIDGVVYDVVVMLQPTCPLRRALHVQSCLEKLVRGAWDSVWTVNATDVKYHPLKQLVIESDGSMRLYDSAGRNIIARQQLKPTFTRNGACYANTRGCLLNQNALLGSRSAAVLIEETMVSIDTLEDFEIVAREMQLNEYTKSSRSSS